jgi:hypothetical protein
MCTAEIANRSDVTVTGVEMSLVRRVTFHVHARTRIESAGQTAIDYGISLQRTGTFSNMSWTVPLDGRPVVFNQQRAVANSNEYFASNPFFMTVPANLCASFNGQLIQSIYQLVFRVRLDACCVRDVRLTYDVNLFTQTSEQVNATLTLPMPTIMNPMSQQRVGVLLQPASTGQYHALLSFSGFDYTGTDQFTVDSMVAYPCFYDENVNAIPTAVNSYNPYLYELLRGHPVALPVPGATTVPGSPMSLPFTAAPAGYDIPQAPLPSANWPPPAETVSSRPNYRDERDEKVGERVPLVNV